MSNNKDIVLHLISSFDDVKVNWGFQMKLAKSLLTKYTKEEIKYAIDYYKNQGIKMTSLGFLSYKNNMKDPCSMYKAELNIMMEENDSGERNRNRIRQSDQAKYREEYPLHLFEKPNEDD